MNNQCVKLQGMFLSRLQELRDEDVVEQERVCKELLSEIKSTS